MRRLLKKKIILLLIVLGLHTPLLSAQEQLLDRVIAVVNQEVITQSEFDALFFPLRAQLESAYQGPELEAQLRSVQQKLISQLIEDKLVLSEAKKRGVEVTDEEVNEKLDEFKKQFGVEQDFNTALKAQGLDVNSFKARLRDQIAIQKLHYVEVQRKVIVSPVEIKNYFDEHPNEFNEKEKVKVWSIMIPKSDHAVRTGMGDEKARKQAESVLKELKKGKDFSELAKTNSQDTHAKDGGLVGYVTKGDMMESIDSVLFQLPEGAFSEIIETERGYHIFKSGDRLPPKSLSLDEAREAIHNLLFRKKGNARFEAWMEELRRKAYISIR